VRIVKPDSAGVGKICIKGKGMFDAYFWPWLRRRNDWFDTGDLGWIDDNGFLYIVGRENNVINFAGMKIFPYEVEAVLNQHPAVKESLVYGVPHAQYGQLPSARIILQNNIEEKFDPNEVRKFCYQHLASYKVPKEFYCVSELEKTSSGKLKRTSQSLKPQS
jgi:long-chain acyl-CoA synthetase